VQNSNTQEHLTLASSDGNAGDVALRGWLREDTARALMKQCGLDFDTLKRSALKRDFQPVALDARLDATLTNRLRHFESRNVVARIPGSDPAHAHETVVYSAHWDHLGTEKVQGKTHIYHGALDNASGVATLIELARKFASERGQLKRSILFLSATGEEKGLLGARYYAEHPLYPLRDTIADLNLDGVNPWGRTSDFELIGMGQTTLDDSFAREAARQGRHVVAESRPDYGYFYRSDHLEFVRKGVPAMHSGGGRSLLGKSAEASEALRAAYTQSHYHKPEDRILPGWNLSGASEDAALYYAVGRALAHDLEGADFKPGSEFVAARQSLLSNPQGAAQP